MWKTEEEQERRRRKRKVLKSRDHIKCLGETDGEIKCERQRAKTERERERKGKGGRPGVFRISHDGCHVLKITAS